MMGSDNAGKIYMMDSNARFWTYDTAATTPTLSATPTAITENALNGTKTLASSTSGGDLAFDNNGVMYVAQYNRVHALDASTGRLIW